VRSLLFLIALAGSAHADDSPHLVYAELLGKGGVYGAGYEYSVAPRMAFGAAGSYVVLRGEAVETAAG